MNLRSIRRAGKPKWKREANYHRRSLAETAMFRFKTIFTDKLQSRKQENQFQEMIIKSAALNRMTHLGMPDSYKVGIQPNVEIERITDLCNKAVA